MQSLKSIFPLEIKGNPWPRRWEPKDQDVYLNDVYFDDDWRFLSKIVISSKDDFLLLKKYYSKKIQYICVLNTEIPNQFKKRCKYVKELKVFSHQPINCHFTGIKKLTMNIHEKNLQSNPNLKKIIKKNKHINSLKVSNFEIFKLFGSPLKTLNNLKTFYLDQNDACFSETMKNLIPFLKSNTKIQKIGLLMKGMWFQEEYDKSIENLLEFKNKNYERLFDSIFNRTSLKSIKLDICSIHLLENQGKIAKNLIERLAHKHLEKFDVRASISDFSDLAPEIENLVLDLNYFAVSTEGEAILSVFGDAEERLRLQRKAKKVLMLNFEGSFKSGILDCLKYPFNELETIDLQFKGESFTIKNKDFHQLCCGKIKNMLLYFDLCSSKISHVLQHFSQEKFSSMDHLGFSLKNLTYDEDIYYSIQNFLKSFHQISYLNLMIYHNLKTDRYKQPKIKIDRIYSTISTLLQLQTLKLSANPPWDTRPILGVAPLFELPQLESMSFFLWLKTAAKVLFSFEFPNTYLSKMKDLTISIYFRLEEEFFDQLGNFLSKLVGLEKLTLSIAYYNKLTIGQFKTLLKKIGTHQNLKEVQMTLNVTNEERETQVDRLQEAIRRGNNTSLEMLIAKMNQELSREKQDIKNEVIKLFDNVKSLKKLLFLHAAKQYFSIAHSR